MSNYFINLDLFSQLPDSIEIKVESGENLNLMSY